LIAMLLTSLPAMHVANAAPPAKDHPVLGSWTMTSKDGFLFRGLPLSA